MDSCFFFFFGGGGGLFLKIYFFGVVVLLCKDFESDVLLIVNCIYLFLC